LRGIASREQHQCPLKTSALKGSTGGVTNIGRCSIATE
jgi:hypothetical protein